jgi:hypothetical protein
MEFVKNLQVVTSLSDRPTISGISLGTGQEKDFQYVEVDAQIFTVAIVMRVRCIAQCSGVIGR